MRKSNWETFGDFAGQIGRGMLYGTLLTAVYIMGDRIANKHECKTAGYDDAVRAIMDSSMFSSDKRVAVTALKRYENAKFYGAIVRIAKDSRMFSSDKVKMIVELSEN